MNESQFRQRLQEKGYPEPEFKEYAPHTDGEMHTHDSSVMLLVIEGVFTLAEESGSTNYQPGESFELPAGVMHVECAGSEGARVLFAKQ
jgi:quercetin dioxygenase-like cupin family protein